MVKNEIHAQAGGKVACGLCKIIYPLWACRMEFGGRGWDHAKAAVSKSNLVVAGLGDPVAFGVRGWLLDAIGQRRR